MQCDERFLALGEISETRDMFRERENLIFRRFGNSSALWMAFLQHQLDNHRPHLPLKRWERR